MKPSHAAMIVHAPLVLGVISIALTAAWLNGARQAADRSADQHRQARDLAEQIRLWQAQPTVVLRTDQPEADAAAWILSASLSAGIAVAQLAIRTSDGAAPAGETRSRTVTCKADGLTAAQADSLLLSVAAHAPAWRVQNIDIERPRQERELKARIRISMTLIARIR